MEQYENAVSVIVPHHLNENDEYLYWCLESITESIFADFEVICISDAEIKPIVPKGVHLIHDRALNNVTKKWNHGITSCSPFTKYMMLISDDVMVSKHTIGELARTIGDQRMILGPASNCDSTTRYFATYYTATQKRLGQKMTMDELRPDQRCIIDFPKMTPVLIDPGWISFYCTMFPKKVLREIGPIDERMDVRWNDVDYCQRARALGIPSMIHLGVFALHFGDRTLPKSTTSADYDLADKAYREKYGITQ